MSVSSNICFPFNPACIEISKRDTSITFSITKKEFKSYPSKSHKSTCVFY